MASLMGQYLRVAMRFCDDNFYLSCAGLRTCSRYLSRIKCRLIVDLQRSWSQADTLPSLGLSSVCLLLLLTTLMGHSNPGCTLPSLSTLPSINKTIVLSTKSVPLYSKVC